jgi:RNA polymerase sigma-70 factor, ECF subfamily
MTAAVVDVAPAAAAVLPAPRLPAAGEETPAVASWRLVEYAQAGDSEAFAEIYRRYHEAVRTFIYRRVRSPHVAEDLTSDTFVRALKSIRNFSWQGRDFGAVLTTIARNLVADFHKCGYNRWEKVLGEAERDTTDRSPEGLPEDTVVGHATNLTLLSAVKELGDEQRECIVLRYLNGLSVAETAAVMGKNEGAIKALTYRAISTLRRRLPEFEGLL